MKIRTPANGFVLTILLFLITVIAVLLAIAIPSYYMTYRRDQEAELIFRASEYTRAIQKHRIKYGTLPRTTEEMLKGSGNVPSLRRPYLDPTTGEAFRPILVNTNDALVGSHLYRTLRTARTNTARNLAGIVETITDNTTGPPSVVEKVELEGLVGVGSQTDKPSVGIFVGQNQYLDWEFIAPVQRTNRPATQGTPATSPETPTPEAAAPRNAGPSGRG